MTRYVAMFFTFAATFLSGCAQSKSDKDTHPSVLRNIVDTVRPCPDSASNLALDKLFPILGMGKIPNYLDVWLSHNYDRKYWEPKFDEKRRKLDDLRVWALSIDDRCARASYIKWLNYYQRELDSARDELKSHAQEKKMNEFDERNAKKREAIEKYQKQIDGAFPDPPKER